MMIREKAVMKAAEKEVFLPVPGIEPWSPFQ
jgi:hypothetical protein